MLLLVAAKCQILQPTGNGLKLDSCLLFKTEGFCKYYILLNTFWDSPGKNKSDNDPLLQWNLFISYTILFTSAKYCKTMHRPEKIFFTSEKAVLVFTRLPAIKQPSFVFYFLSLKERFQVEIVKTLFVFHTRTRK